MAFNHDGIKSESVQRHESLKAAAAEQLVHCCAVCTCLCVEEDGCDLCVCACLHVNVSSLNRNLHECVCSVYSMYINMCINRPSEELKRRSAAGELNRACACILHDSLSLSLSAVCVSAYQGGLCDQRQ